MRHLAHPVCLCAILVAVCGGTAAGAASADAERQARVRDIQKARAALDAELAAHGGTWEKWAADLKNYRDDLKSGAKAPPTANLQFQGQSMQVIQLDDFDALPEGYRPFDAITNLNHQLQARGIDLIVAVIPSKLCVYPDYFNVASNQPARAPADRQVALCVKRLMKKLLENDVEAIDLYTAFQEARRKTNDKVMYVYDRDSHWRNAGACVAADAIAERLKRYGFVQTVLAKGNPYVMKPGRREDAAKADDVQIVQTADGKMYWDVGDSPVIQTGDSYSQYNQKQDAPAHLSAQIALRIGLPLTILAHSGLSFDMPTELARLAKEQDYLRGRRVIVWTFNDKMIPLGGGKPKWSMAELPVTNPTRSGVSASPAAEGTRAVTARVVEVSAPPPKNPPYPHYFLVVHVKDMKDSAGKTVGTGEGVLHILAMHQRRNLPVAATQAGDVLQVQVAPWSSVEKEYGKFHTGSLANTAVQVGQTHYLGEIAGAPKLTADDIRKAGEE